MTTLIYLIGRSGTGKYTIAKAIAKSGGYKIADNHLINNPIFSLIEPGTQVPSYAWEAIEQIRKSVFEFITYKKTGSFILTNELFEDDEGNKACFAQVEEISKRREFVFVPVKLIISNEENARRIARPARAKRYKSTIIEKSKLERPLIEVSHKNLLELEVSNLAAKEAAKQILEHVDKIVRNN